MDKHHAEPQVLDSQNMTDSDSESETDNDTDSNNDTEKVLSQFSFHSKYQDMIKRVHSAHPNGNMPGSVNSPSAKSSGNNPTKPKNTVDHSQDETKLKPIASASAKTMRNTKIKPIESATAKTDLIDIFIGNVSTENSIDDIVAHATKLGVDGIINTKLLSEKYGKRSFLMTVPVQHEGCILNKENWPMDVKIQLFRPKRASTKNPHREPTKRASTKNPHREPTKNQQQTQRCT